MDDNMKSKLVSQIEIYNILKYMELIKPPIETWRSGGIQTESYMIERWYDLMYDIGEKMGIDVLTLYDRKRKWP